MYDLEAFYQAAAGRQIVLYGAGGMGAIWHRLLRWMELAPVCFCDNQPEKQGTVYLGVPVFNYAQAEARYSDAFWIVTPYCAEAMKIQLEQVGRYRPVQEQIDWPWVERLYERASTYQQLQVLLADCERDQTSFWPQQFTLSAFSKIVVVSPTGRAGSFYFASLLDGHTCLLSVSPLISGSCLSEYKTRWKHAKGVWLVLQVFDYCVVNGLVQDGDNPGPYLDWFQDEQGHFRKDLQVPKEVFLRQLYKLLMPLKKINLGVIIKAIHCAYANAKGIPYDRNVSYHLVMHYHTLSPEQTKEFIAYMKMEFESISCVLMVRQPMENLCALLRSMSKISPYYNESYHQMIASWDGLHFGSFSIGCPGMQEDDYGCETRFVRFEDLKRNQTGTLQACCDFLQIPYEPCLENTTAGGKPVYVNAGTAVPITGNYQGGVTRDYSFMLTSFDRFRLELLFADLDVRYGYTPHGQYPPISSFSETFLRELYTPPFLLETVCFGAYPDFQKGFRKALWEQLARLREAPPAMRAKVLYPCGEE